MADRTAREFRFTVPTREDVRKIFNDLENGAMSLEDASDWAAEFVMYDNPEIYPEISDQVVWNAIDTLHGADMKVSVNEYLYGNEDIKNWLVEFDHKCLNEPSTT